jgi:hypothetical protein
MEARGAQVRDDVPQEPEEDYLIPAYHGGLPADHPVLREAQEKLRQQLLATKKRLEEELRQRQHAIKVPSADIACCSSSKSSLYPGSHHVSPIGQCRTPASWRVWNANLDGRHQQASQECRLNLGVELYGFQQQLARLLTSVKEKESKVEELAVERKEEEAEIAKLCERADKGTKDLEAKRAEVSAGPVVLFTCDSISLNKSGMLQTP